MERKAFLERQRAGVAVGAQGCARCGELGLPRLQSMSLVLPCVLHLLRLRAQLPLLAGAVLMSWSRGGRIFRCGFLAILFPEVPPHAVVDALHRDHLALQGDACAAEGLLYRLLRVAALKKVDSLDNVVEDAGVDRVLQTLQGTKIRIAKGHGLGTEEWKFLMRCFHPRDDVRLPLRVKKRFPKPVALPFRTLRSFAAFSPRRCGSDGWS